VHNIVVAEEMEVELVHHCQNGVNNQQDLFPPLPGGQQIAAEILGFPTLTAETKAASFNRARKPKRSCTAIKGL
jgi:hypothetical protein